jgi:predicted PhzF superfamily epimerase YddE/YHI9
MRRPQKASVPLGLIYHHVDVFSSRPLSGNGVTVFRLREALSTAVMCSPWKKSWTLLATQKEGRTWDNDGRVEDIATGSAAGPQELTWLHTDW